MSESSSDEDEELSWGETLQLIKENDPRVEEINCFHFSEEDDLQNMTDEELEELGNAIAKNTHLKKVKLSYAFLNEHKVTFLFQGLTRSSSVEEMLLNGNNLSTVGVRSMVPFLQSANNLTYLDVGTNKFLQSEGFNVLFRALRDSPIETLQCNDCGIDSLEIDIEHLPKHLKKLRLFDNSINSDGCRGLAKLLQGGSTLTDLSLQRNQIDDDGVGILVGALRSNTSLRKLFLSGNKAISTLGQTKLLKLLNDVSSIEATLQSNHTLTFLERDLSINQIRVHIDKAIGINSNASSPEAAGREKVVETQLNSERRAELAALQGVNHSVYSEIDPVHLPEVLVLVGRHHGQGELYLALKSSIADLISTVNRMECLKQQRDYHLARAKHLEAEIVAIEAAEGEAASIGCDSRSNKKRRAC